MEWTSFVKGAGLNASLIVAIGAQNAYVLQQGLRRHHVLPVALTCALSDALLIVLGVAGAGAFLSGQPLLMHLVSLAGAGYLLVFGCSALRRAWRTTQLDPAARTSGRALGRVLAATLALTFLNPHVYLDMVVLLGSVGARESESGQPAFALGAMLTSFTWFFALAYGAQRLAPWLARPRVWRVIDLGVGILALVLAAGLITS